VGEKALQYGNIQTAYKFTEALRHPAIQKLQENICCGSSEPCYMPVPVTGTKHCSQEHDFGQETGYDNIPLSGKAFNSHQLHFCDSSAHLRS
jgi:hypothetical protein